MTSPALDRLEQIADRFKQSVSRSMPKSPLPGHLVHEIGINIHSRPNSHSSANRSRMEQRPLPSTEHAPPDHLLVGSGYMETEIDADGMECIDPSQKIRTEKQLKEQLPSSDRMHNFDGSYAITLRRDPAQGHSDGGAAAPLIDFKALKNAFASKSQGGKITLGSCLYMLKDAL